jgi:WXG100 family type VII secretion target
MTDITVKPDRVDALAGSVEGGARGIDAALQTLQGSKGVLLTQWRGDAADAYAGAQEKWIQDMRTLAQVGRAASDAARSAAAAYRDADDAVGRTWGL